MTTARPDPLLGAGFVRELEVLRRRLEIRARSGGAGEHVATRRGGSAEFKEHRAYAPGDDMRRIDWAAYARTGEPVLKLFRAEEDVIARIVCDASASLDFGEPTKLDAARRLAAAIGYMTLARSERAQLFVAGDGIAREHTPLRGRSGLTGLLRALDGVQAGGGTHLARAVDSVIQRSHRPGMLVAISDFFEAGRASASAVASEAGRASASAVPSDGGLVTAALGRAVQAGHDVALVQVVAAEEIEPALEGDWTLEDAETGALVEVTMDAAALDAYARRFAALCEGLGVWARRHRATYVRVRTDEPLESAVRRFVARSVD